MTESPPPKRRREEEREADAGLVKKGRGRFTLEEIAEVPKKKIDGPLSRSKWAQND